MQVIEKLVAAGFQALWAGGCVRDELLGKLPKDYDVATSATPDEIQSVFKTWKTLPIGAAFGVITIVGRNGAQAIEVATFRQDAEYSDGRHPDAVKFSSAEEDALRRDFTINGLFFDPIKNEVIDFVGGKQDLAAKVVRAIRDPHERIAEDKLRMLRAVRFTATFGFQLEHETLAAIKQNASQLNVVSFERIYAELKRMLIHENRSQSFELLEETGLLSQCITESTSLINQPEVIKLLSKQLQHVNSTNAFELSILLILRKCFSDQCFSDHRLIDQSQDESNTQSKSQSKSQSKRIEKILRRLKMTVEEIKAIRWIIESLDQLMSAKKENWPQIQRLLIQPFAKSAVECARIICETEGLNESGVDFCERRLSWPADDLNPPPLIDGAALKELDIPTGPIFRKLLGAVRDAQLRGEITSEEEAIKLVEKLK